MLKSPRKQDQHDDWNNVDDHDNFSQLFFFNRFSSKGVEEIRFLASISEREEAKIVIERVTLGDLFSSYSIFGSCVVVWKQGDVNDSKNQKEESHRPRGH